MKALGVFGSVIMLLLCTPKGLSNVVSFRHWRVETGPAHHQLAVAQLCVGVSMLSLCPAEDWPAQRRNLKP